MTLRLEYTSSTSVPLEVEGVLPEHFRDKSISEIERWTVFHGNQQLALADFFRVSGDPADEVIEWEGTLSGVHWIGAKMTRGSIRVHGSAGRHIGSQMHGGRIEVDGDAGDWVGAEMAGGVIRVHGSAGHLIGAAYRGSARGMTGGTILIDGNVGNEIAHSMRRGLLAVGGDAGDLIGFNLLAGSVLVFGDTGIRHGAGMRRGTIGLFGTARYEPLPSFRRACRCQMEVLRLIGRMFRQHAFPCPVDLANAAVDIYHGDMLEGGRGELLLRTG